MHCILVSIRGHMHRRDADSPLNRFVDGPEFFVCMSLRCMYRNLFNGDAIVPQANGAACGERCEKCGQLKIRFGHVDSFLSGAYIEKPLDSVAVTAQAGIARRWCSPTILSVHVKSVRHTSIVRISGRQGLRSDSLRRAPHLQKLRHTSLARSSIARDGRRSWSVRYTSVQDSIDFFLGACPRSSTCFLVARRECFRTSTRLPAAIIQREPEER